MTVTPVRDNHGNQLTDKHGRLLWDVQISAGFAAGGKRKRPSKRVHGSHREAQRIERELLNKADKVQPDRKITFAEWTEDVLTRLRKRDRADSTIDCYRKILRKRILPKLGGLRLDNIAPSDITRFMAWLSQQQDQQKKQAISGHTQLKHYRLIHLIFQEAVYDGLLTDNPVDAVRPPRKEKYTAPFFDPADLGAVWDALMQEPRMWQAIMASTLLCGLSRAEMMALRWSRIDWEKGTLAVTNNATRVTGTPQQVKKVKTETRYRVVPMPEPLPSILLAWHIEQGGADEDFVAAEPTANGLRWISIDRPTRWFAEFVTRHKLPKVTPHGLRHTYVTGLLAQGLTLADAARLAGHSTTATTANVYSHATGDLHNRARLAITGLLAKKPAKQSATPPDSPSETVDPQ